MKFFFIILFFYKILFVISSIPNWDIESLSVDLFSSSSSGTQYEYILYNHNNYILKQTKYKLFYIYILNIKK
jgi:hypothetical protein